MLTESTTRSVSLQADVNLGESDTLRLGAERQTYVLYDFWPPVGGSMGPRAFWNIDNGQRIRAGAFAEWEGSWGPRWTALAGVRADEVRTDTGPVQGYDNGLGAIWGNEATSFNALQRARRDRLLDLALMLRFKPDAGSSYELGLARKGRAPNLYQRYPWSTQAMAALMNNFVGDGNGYVGNPDLKPEVAHKLAFTAEWRDPAREDWQLKATAHLSRVQNFMDARRCDVGQCSADNVSTTRGFVLLQFTNQPARLHGLDLSAQAQLARSDTLGDWRAQLVASTVHGRNLATGDRLYNLMPTQLRLSLEHRLGPVTTVAELVGVAAKDRVSQVRNEIRTPGHALAHLRTSIEWPQARLDLGVENLFNRSHVNPLGGAYVGQGPSMTTNGIPWGTAVPGPGRSLNAALQLYH